MKKLFVILFFSTLWAFTLNAQPMACMGQSIVIIDSITEVDEKDVTVYLGQIRYNDPNFPNSRNISPVWSECLKNNTFDSRNLELYPATEMNCENFTERSISSGRFYLVGYQIVDAVLVIESQGKVMYLVLPIGNANRVNSYLTNRIYKDLFKDNLRDGKEAFYTLNLHLPSIEFREGIFFLKDYDLSDSTKYFKRYQAKEIVEFYQPNQQNRVSPLSYWRSEISLFSPYSNSLELFFSKQFEGLFSQEEAIKIIVENGSNYTREIVDYVYWEKYVKNNPDSELDRAMTNLIYEVKQFQDRIFDELTNRYEKGEMSILQLTEDYRVMEKEHLFLILENDFFLVNMFCNYLNSPKTDIQDFLSFFEEGSFKIKQSKLKQFLEENRK